MFEHLQREREAFELFKEAYRARFPAGEGWTPQFVDLNVPTPEPSATAAAALLFVALDAALLVSADEGVFAELEWP